MHIEKTNEIWEYDGSFYGFLTIVYHAFSKKKFPEIILTPTTALESLFQPYYIDTDETLAIRIYERLTKRVRKENSQFIIDSFYCSLKEKERYLLDAIQISLESGDLLTNHLGHSSILALQKSVKALYSEVHSFTGFIRFEYVGKLLYSSIKPKHFSLPYLCPHFAKRYPQELIIIYDETHRLLGIIEQGHTRFIENSDLPTFNTKETEQKVQDNWRTFLQAVTFQERKNERAQLSHLPKRYRSHMIDFD
ncbi:TIGR03915 family putative DNA repair protein [Enterococcus sp. AZ126]|uniref:TIGR03915 family putative DNA repair protein n=1 Tax=Enterococcus sp. AZ126 TaxID=2774635 RepID=UPI003F200380